LTLKERFRIEKEGENYKIVQHTIDTRNAAFMKQIYNEIKAKRDAMLAQIDDIPKKHELIDKQKENMEENIKTLGKRIDAIKPFLSEIDEKIKKEEEKLKAEAEKNKEDSMKDVNVVVPFKGGVAAIPIKEAEKTKEEPEAIIPTPMVRTNQ